MMCRFLLFPALLLSALSGCASVPADAGRGDAAALAAGRGLPSVEHVDAAAFTADALDVPVTAEVAVQLALLNNPDFRRRAAALGFAAAELHDAARLANPALSLTRLSGDSSAGGRMPQLSLGIAFNFLDLLLLPANSRYAQARFAAAKMEVAATTLELAADVEAAWFEAAGSEQLALMRDAAASAQRAAAELAQRYFDAGNINARELAMERAAASQAALAALTARGAARDAHAALNRLMGLTAAQARWTLDARLAEPPAETEDVVALQGVAIDSRLDVAAMRQRAEAIAGRFGLERRTRFINGIELGAERERDFDGAINAGPTLSLEIPLFNWGGGRVAAAQAALDESEAELDARVLDVSNDVARSVARLQILRKLASEYRDALVPQRETIVAHMQQEQNYMLIGIFEVLAARQQVYDAYAGYIDTVRAYWVARSELARAVGRRLPGGHQAGVPTLDAAEILEPKHDANGHGAHSMHDMDHGPSTTPSAHQPGHHHEH